MFHEPTNQGLFDAAGLAEVEGVFPDGVSAQQVISLFQERGIKMSEATFRKYVQLGLLPTSRRVGRKGKHRGSRGVYPIVVVRRINLIKRLMNEGRTLEEILDGFVSPQNDVEQLSEAMEGLVQGLEDRLLRLAAAGQDAKALARETEKVRKAARILVGRIERLSSRITVAVSNIQEEE